ncbi:polypeptide N-acetylgalactosaminyltransferase 5-like [Ylistrum balloti]|uniref:polypeptide N-acetylgalactosaminyltransferase 5-like n=1 Tax=Ylistrum balloti TaxID=509963 RepID=UPI0029059FD4|nr:polypeptide N-acetylgalactosaminyltransferase 5-like [Ylistrum balloti]
MPRIHLKRCVIKLVLVFSFVCFFWTFVYRDELAKIENNDDFQVEKEQLIKRNEDQLESGLTQRQRLSLGLENKKHFKTIVKKTGKVIPDGKADVKVQDHMNSKGHFNINDGKGNKDRVNIKNVSSGPGELGEAVHIDVKSLTPEEKKKYDKGWKNNAFNEYVSDMISLDRSLEDTRDPECKTMEYSNMLPDASVIITFHNEAWSVLLRSVHSIINRTPPTLLKEIILVDDYSDMAHLREPLEEYMRRYDKVKILRARKREGLIRSRLLGYNTASGTVLIYLDSHIECLEGWIEPLLDPIARDKTTSVTPIIESIDFTTFRFKISRAKDVQVGGFDWSLVFNWHKIPDSERARRNFKHYLPARSPTMAGGLFAISREYFTYLGTYDEGMNIWGAENLEISFRIWMCGGTLLTAPCSRVGHVFRETSPYTWPGKNILLHNNLRLAEVWLDDFKSYYYGRVSQSKVKETDYGDISARVALRKRLQCKSFRWFLSNVFPELYIPGNSVASGEIRNKAKPVCLDGKDRAAANNILRSYPCHQQGGNQFWLHMKDGAFRRDILCFDYFIQNNELRNKEIQLFACHGQRGNQEWEYREDNTIFHVNTKKCITLAFDGRSVFMEECRGTDSQLWIMEKKPVRGPTI